MVLTLKAARVNNGFSQKKLGELIGVSPSTICRWETGIQPIPETALEQYRSLCNAGADEVLAPRGRKKEAIKK